MIMGTITDVVPSNDNRITIKPAIACSDGALGFMEDLAKSAGDDLIYSLALEKGNMFMCVTAFPSLTKKRFDTEDDGLRAVFHLPESDFKLSQDELVENLTQLIEEHTYYAESSIDKVVDDEAT
jgi:hypothetical protein